jgi:hypothetical protein
MAEWESEVAALLRSLDVSFGDDSQPAENASADLPPEAETAHAGLEDDADLSFVGRPTPRLASPDEPVSVVRREIEATLTRVIQLTRAGQLDRALRDDVVFVLRALTRPCPAAEQEDEPDEWQLASAAAVLHFCRVVTRLTRPLAHENGL